MSNESVVKVRQVMTPDPVCCIATDTVQRVAAILRDRHIGSVPVLQDHQSRKLIGMITDRDLCCAVLACNLEGKGILVRQVFTKNPVRCHADDDVNTCLSLIERYHVRRLPVVDEEDRCVGIISLTDLASKAHPQSVAKAMTTVSKVRSSRTSAA